MRVIIAAILMGAFALAGNADAAIFVPEDVDFSISSGYYLDGSTDQVFHYDGNTSTLTPAAGVDPAGLYDIDVVPPGQKPGIVTGRTETCGTNKVYCIGIGYALVGGNKVEITRVHTDQCLPVPIEQDRHVTPIPVIQHSSWESVAGGCCGTVYADMYIQDRWRDGDSMGWRSSFGCP